jgi:ABC-2 type transport system ATP-binding protein
MIEIEGLVRRFGPLTAVGGISLRVAKGEVLGFLGPNGAGKSTTMKMITGFLAPTEGRITVCGHDVVEEPMKAQASIGYLPEGAPAYPDMTAHEFLAFIATVRGLKADAAKKAIDMAVARTGLGSVLDQRIETLSKGFKRRVGLAQAILHDPPVLIMDEPTDGLDPNQKHSARELIKAMSADKAIIISTHILEEVDAVCTRAIIIDKGRIVADGTPGELERKAASHKLDDVFRALTTSGGLPPRVLRLFRDAARLRLHRDLPALDGHVHVLLRLILRERPRRVGLLLRLSSLALSLLDPGNLDAALG